MTFERFDFSPYDDSIVNLLSGWLSSEFFCKPDSSLIYDFDLFDDLLFLLLADVLLIGINIFYYD
jgi:hypothetical protein